MFISNTIAHIRRHFLAGRRGLAKHRVQKRGLTIATPNKVNSAKNVNSRSIKNTSLQGNE